MKKQSYQRILAVLISLMILLTAGMAIVGAGLLQTREDSPDILPEATDTADSDELLMASDLAPDPAKWFLPYDGDLTDADGNPVRLSALCGKTTILLFWSGLPGVLGGRLWGGGTDRTSGGGAGRSCLPRGDSRRHAREGGSRIDGMRHYRHSAVHGCGRGALSHAGTAERAVSGGFRFAGAPAPRNGGYAECG